jgi:hypothetical protein
MATITPLTAAMIITGVGQCIIDKLEETPESGGVPDKMRICLLVPGAIAADGCDCGQFAQSIVRSNPSDIFPQDSSLSPLKGVCGQRSRMWTVTASIMRCVPCLKEINGKVRMPTCAEQLTAALIQEGDAWAMWTAAQCCLAEQLRNRVITSYFVGTTEPYGPEGCCGGVDLTYGFQIVQ